MAESSRVSFENVGGQYNFADLTETDKLTAGLKAFKKGFAGEDGLEAGIEEAKALAANRRLQLRERDTQGLLEAIINGEDPAQALSRFKRADPNAAHTLWQNKKNEAKEELARKHGNAFLMAVLDEGIDFNTALAEFPETPNQTVTDVYREISARQRMERGAQIEKEGMQLSHKLGREGKEDDVRLARQELSRKGEHLAVLAAIHNLFGTEKAGKRPSDAAFGALQVPQNVERSVDPSLAGKQAAQQGALSPAFLQAIEGDQNAEALGMKMFGATPEEQTQYLTQSDEGFAEIFPEFAQMMQGKRQEDRLTKSLDEESAHRRFLEEGAVRDDKRADRAAALSERRLKAYEKSLNLRQGKTKTQSPKEFEQIAMGNQLLEGKTLNPDFWESFSGADDPNLIMLDDEIHELRKRVMAGNDKKAKQDMLFLMKRWQAGLQNHILGAGAGSDDEAEE